MLFNSYLFILLFVPVTYLCCFACRRIRIEKIELLILLGASFFFYGWWNAKYLLFLGVSLVINYTLGLLLTRRKERSIVFFGIAINLCFLGYFKYKDFFIENVSLLIGREISCVPVVLPLAISFFTFQQIIFLVDTYRGETAPGNFLEYALFVTFFPQLIAGPIVYHREIKDQLANWKLRNLCKNVSVGLIVFFIGLFKKVVFADTIATYSTPAFDAVASGTLLTFFEAWGAALAYTFQIYFDFSGYTDMAIGVACIFGINLPINFFSPYKSRNIIEFWRRWHITLSRFLRDYVYFPLGGNRRGKIRRYSNLLATMFLGGLWHGAGWTFVIWGGLHGAFLCINHAWQSFFGKSENGKGKQEGIGDIFNICLTFLCLVFTWVIFRSDTINSAWKMIQSMIGINGFVIPKTIANIFVAVGVDLSDLGFQSGVMMYFHNPLQVVWIMLLATIVWVFPNTQQILHREQVGLDSNKQLSMNKNTRFQWVPSGWWAFFFAIVSVLGFYFISKK